MDCPPGTDTERWVAPVPSRRPPPLERPPERASRQWHRPAGYGLLAVSVVLALVTAGLALRLGFRLADAGKDAADFSAGEPILVVVLGALAVVTFRWAERWADF